MHDEPIGDVIRAHTDSLVSLSGVIGVGQGRCDDADCIVIFVESMTSEVEALPKTLEGHPLRIEVTGPVTAPPDE